MECRHILRYIDELLDDTLSDPLRGAMQQHLGHCAHCRQAVAQARAMSDALRNWPAPQPPAGFHERVLRNAAARHRPRVVRPTLFSLAIAASLVIGVAVGLLFARVNTDRSAAAPAIALAVERPQNINLAFESAHPLRGVMLTVRLPEAVEVVGYPGRREIAWRTDLRAGSNRLTLPLVAHGGAGGALTAQLEHDAQRKAFTLHVDVQHQPDAARDMPYLPS